MQPPLSTQPVSEAVTGYPRGVQAVQSCRIQNNWNGKVYMQNAEKKIFIKKLGRLTQLLFLYILIIKLKRLYG